MPAATPNYGLLKPDFDSTDWHVPLWFNADTIDTAMAAIQADLDSKFSEVSGARTSLVYTNESPFASLTLRLDEIEDELKQARRGFSGPAQRLLDYLSIGHDAAGNNLAASYTPNLWETGVWVTVNWVDASTIKVLGADYTAIFEPNTTIKIEFAGNPTQYLHVKSSVLNGSDTDITVWDDESVTNDTINTLTYGFYRDNVIGAAANTEPGSSVRDITDCALEIYYYSPTYFDQPFNDAGGRISQTPSGDDAKIARVEYASGWAEGISYDSADADAKIDETVGVEARLNGTFNERYLPIYDVTTGLLISVDRVFV